MRNGQISRIYSILDLLSESLQGMTVNELADRIQAKGHRVGKRTIYRDLQALHAAGFPLCERDHNEDKSTRWAMDTTKRINDYLVLSINELIALYLSRSALNLLSETAFFEDLQRAFLKIEEKLGSRQREFVDSLSSEIYFDPLPKWGLGANPDVIETIRIACSESHCLKIGYCRNHNSAIEERIVGPHCLYFSSGSLYLLCEDLDDAKIKTFALPRLKSAQMLADEYTNKKLDPSDYYQSSFSVFQGSDPVEVKLQFNESVAPYIKERRWHQTQRITPNPDGTVTMNLEVSMTPDLVMWILGFGADLVIQAPMSLRDRVCEQARALLRQYDKDVA